MFRYSFTCSALLLGLLAVILPTASQATEVPCSTCRTNPPEVEVSYNREYASGNLVVAPLLPSRGKAFRKLEHEYYEYLSNLASDMCLRTSNELSDQPNRVVGFSAQYTKYQLVRHLLNKLLNRYRLGDAPSIEDFTHNEGLEFITPPRRFRETASHRWVPSRSGPIETQNEELSGGVSVYCSFRPV